MRYDLIVRVIHSENLTLDQLATQAEMHPAVIQRLTEVGLIQPVTPMNAMVFKASNILRLRSIKRLRSELGINLQGVAAVLDLVERLQNLEQENAHLRAKL